MQKLAVITGASRGIGKQAAELFLDKGYQVVNLSRTACPINGVVNIAWDLAAPEWPADGVASLTELAALAERTCLIHNAALLRKDTISNLNAGDLRQVLEVNVVAPQRLNALLLPYMKPGSAILYLGSTLAEKAVANAYSYVVSKHAGVGMMRANCQDLAGQGIHTANICPGFTDTEMLREHLRGNDQALAGITGGVSFGRLIEPAEIARLLLFCAENPVLNGSVIHASLGQVEH